MSLLEAITFAIAVVGAVLGVINTRHALDKSRVKLRVVPKQVIPLGTSDATVSFCVEVTNLSDFAVTIDEVGFLRSGTERRSAYVLPLVTDGGPWPRRLESRSSVTVYGATPRTDAAHPFKCAYARTQCGVTCRGSSAALRALNEMP